MRLPLCLFAGAFLLLLPAISSAAEDDPAIAEVNGRTIHQSDLDAAYEQLPQQYRQVPRQAIAGPLRDRLIDDELLREEAERSRLQDDPGVQREMERARARVLRNAYLQRLIDKASTEDKLRATYEAMKKEPGFAVEEAHLRHILVPTEEEAKKIIAQLDSGADFVELAKKYSTGPSAKKGGDLGFVTKDALVPEFSAVAFSLEPGTYTRKPVKTRFGWHVIYMVEKRTKVPSFEEVQDKVRERAARQAIEAELERLRKDAHIVRKDLPRQGSGAAAQ